MIPSGGRQETNMGKREGILFQSPYTERKKQPVQKWADRMRLMGLFRNRFESVQLYVRHTDWLGRLSAGLGTPEMDRESRICWNSEWSPTLSKFLGNIRVFEDHVNHWALGHVKIQLSIFQMIYNGARMYKSFMKPQRLWRHTWNITSFPKYLI